MVSWVPGPVLGPGCTIEQENSQRLSHREALHLKGEGGRNNKHDKPQMRQALHRDEDVLTPVAVGRKETTVLKKGTAKRPETQAGASVQKPRTRHPGTGASEHTAQSQEVLALRAEATGQAGRGWGAGGPGPTGPCVQRGELGGVRVAVATEGLV